MTVADEHGRVQPPSAGDEVATLVGFLDYQRATFAWKCSGLGAEGLSATVGASSLTLGGMLKHLALVEESWFSQRLHGRPLGSPWAEVDWSADPDWDLRSAADQTPDELRTLWEASVERSRQDIVLALADGGPGRPARWARPDGRTPNLRWILCHMIEEYARHNGHADLIRESVDGSTGE
ncbi:MAG TPA: DinB family protein [Kineosporiaceae bacterium]|nr:DinB family protein [Kineosporiaceae bacterium]